MKKIVEEFISLIESKGKTMKQLGFSEGAADEEILKIEAKTKQVLPDDFKVFFKLYKWSKKRVFFLLA